MPRCRARWGDGRDEGVLNLALATTGADAVYEFVAKRGDFIPEIMLTAIDAVIDIVTRILA